MVLADACCLLQVRSVDASGRSQLDQSACIAEVQLSPGQKLPLQLLPAAQPAMRVLDEEGNEYSWEASGAVVVASYASADGW